jgi:hypothetical protein
VGGAAEPDHLGGVDHGQDLGVALSGGRVPAVPVDATLAVVAVDVARPAVAADGEQLATMVGGNDLGVAGDAVAVKVEQHDVAGFGLPAAPGHVAPLAVVEGLGAAGEAGPAAGLHRRQGDLRALVDVGDEVGAPRLYRAAQVVAERVRAVVAMSVQAAVEAHGGADDLVSGSHLGCSYRRWMVPTATLGAAGPG